MCIRDRQYCFFMSEGDLLAALEKLHALQAKHDEKERNLHDLAKKMSELHYMHQEADEENRRLTKQLNAVRSEFESKICICIRIPNSSKSSRRRNQLSQNYRPVRGKMIGFSGR
eukprot:TRINITY_DN1339_c0_g2_i2.p1 TRINITY_DN1339_c0_g2~~TRINITY_DN1339_c0_g2_i2.p1  ORF type:complete len:114 (+),score=16.67 TRINITY_DN1339_c0_g2_i2:65-406(+)